LEIKAGLDEEIGSHPGFELPSVNQMDDLFEIVSDPAGTNRVFGHRVSLPKSPNDGRSLSKKKAEVNYQNETIVSGKQH
jgi:hypothetical protein